MVGCQMQTMPCPKPLSFHFHWSWCCFIVACLMCITQLQLIGADDTATTDADGDEGFANLVAWMKSHGGRVDPSIDIAITTSGVRGAIALSPIEEGAELLFCPWKLVIGSTGSQPDRMMQKGDGMCQVVEQMAGEIRQTSESLWHPYSDHIELPRLAAVWDGSALVELQGIPPNQDFDRHVQWFKQSCEGDLDDAAIMFSLVAFISRASEVGMIPIYDLLNHHNGKRNAKLFITEEGVQLSAVGDIRQGEEIFLSYGLKTASTMYRDYGFVEEWPTAWNFRDPSTADNFAFVQLSNGVVAVNPSAEYLKSIWNSNMSQAQYEADARRHTRSLSVADLDRFAQAAHNHLNEFPSTLGEDEAILVEKELLLAGERLASNRGDTSKLEDIISAIKYRISFKVALTGSFGYAESMIRDALVREMRQEL